MLSLSEAMRRGYEMAEKYARAAFKAGFLDVDAGLNVHVDFYRHDGKLFVEAELPGVRPEDVELNVCADKLTLSAEKSAEKKEGGEDKSYFRSERSYGKVERMISFPVEVDPESARASFRNGVLTVEMTEKSQEKGYRKVKIGRAHV